MAERAPEYWNCHADAVRQLAEKTRDAKVRSYLLEIAAMYERLAVLEKERLARRDLPKAD